MQSLARPRAPMGAAASQTHPPKTQKPGPDGSQVRRDAQRRGGPGAGPGGSLGTTAEVGAKTGGRKPLKPAWAVGLVEMTDGETGEIFYARSAHDCSLPVVR